MSASHWFNRAHRLLIWLSLSVLSTPGGQAADGKTLQFQTDILPIFQESCGKCHSENVSMGKLRLDSEAAILQGGVSGPVVVPGKSGESLLVKRILGTIDAPRMPMGSDPLPAAKVQLIRSWIDNGDFKAATATHTSPQGETNPAAPKSALFATSIRPILATRCYSCHGPDVQQNGLRLDSLAALLKGSDSGKIVIPGHSDQSRLVRRLMAQERPQMPYGGPALSANEISAIRQWIDAGAPGPDSNTPIAATKTLKHWAYVKPVKPLVPQAAAATWPRNPIDNFILARLEKEGLKPSPEAGKEILLRRVYLDLTGLPPSPQEVDAFVADKSADAYEKVVDRLLASPHYGERWARPWLDLARYADSNGYEKDRPRVAWAYRDWVIRALNADMSFRDFTIDQIAGDMLPNPSKDQLTATGFHRNSMLNQEGGIDVEEYYWLSLVDRVNTTASVWLGATLGCAQCHNHKFDPFTQKDYYRFLAFFGNAEHKVAGSGDRWAEEPELELPTQQQDKKSKELREQIAQLQTVLDTETPQLEAAQKSWENEMRSAEKQWSVIHPKTYASVGGATLKLLDDGSILATGKNPQADTYTVEAKMDSEQITGLRLEVLPDASLPRGGPGRDAEGNFFLSDLEITAAPANNPSETQRIVWKGAAADESQDGYDVKGIVKKEDSIRGWAIDAKTSGADKQSLRRQAIFVPDKPFGSPGGTMLTITLKHQMRHATRNIGRFRLSVTSGADPQFLVRIPASLRPVLDITSNQRTTEPKEALAKTYRAVAPLLDPTRKQIASLQNELEKQGIVTTQVMQELPSYTHPATYVRERGSFMSKGDLVYADVPGALSPLPKEGMPNRLGLAQWLVSEDNPLTARVTVNHFWETIFGRGIVETSEDFGTQGDPPSHPELLDWLATKFIEDGWSMKKIQRLMVTSATYRQSSRVTPDLIARDPYNRLYARGPRFRVEAETVHDIALSASGLLSPKMFGPSVFPYQPAGVWDVPYSKEKWVQSEGADRFRRSIYTFIRRSAPYPSLVTWDAPSREFCTVRRVRTNTPLQALTTLNDPYFFDAARAMAKRMMSEGGTNVEERATYGFRLAVSRQPAKQELERLLDFYNRQLSKYKEDEKSAAQTIGVESGNDKSAPEWAAWTMVANVLLNMDETISKD
jgi:hypothetical protein